MCSYRLAQAAVIQGLEKLHKLGVPTKRPEDYFAEMAKSDEHMKRVTMLFILVMNMSIDFKQLVFVFRSFMTITFVYGMLGAREITCKTIRYGKI